MGITLIAALVQVGVGQIDLGFENKISGELT